MACPPLPRHGGVRELRAAVTRSRGRRAGDTAEPLPRAAIHRHRARRLAGAVPSVEGQPFTDAQQHVRVRRGRWRPRADRRRVVTSVHGTSEKTRRVVHSLTKQYGPTQLSELTYWKKYSHENKYLYVFVLNLFTYVVFEG